jgi:NAD+ kinase
MRVGIVAQKGNDRAAFLAADLRERLRAEAVDVYVDEATAGELDVEGTPVGELYRCDFIVTVGGDGTFIFAAHGADGTPLLGVNLGEVGFLNAVGPSRAIDAVVDTVTAFRRGDAEIREIPRIAARSDDWVGRGALNEVVVQGSRRGPGSGLGVEIRVDGSLYSGGHADGVLVATPTGSTAYNLSERGPLVHPSVDGLVVTEMCADGGMPPLVVPSDAEVSVTLTDAEEAVVASDGRVSRRLTPPTELTVSVTDRPVRLAGPSSGFFEALAKLD